MVEFFADEEWRSSAKSWDCCPKYRTHWQRDSVLEDIAPHLPEPMFGSGARGGTYHSGSRYRASRSVAWPITCRTDRDHVYVEAFAIVEQMDEDFARAHALIEISVSPSDAAR